MNCSACTMLVELTKPETYYMHTTGEAISKAAVIHVGCVKQWLFFGAQQSALREQVMKPAR